VIQGTSTQVSVKTTVCSALRNNSCFWERACQLAFVEQTRTAGCGSHHAARRSLVSKCFPPTSTEMADGGSPPNRRDGANRSRRRTLLAIRTKAAQAKKLSVYGGNSEEMRLDLLNSTHVTF
jgi:hypothetical protein